MCYANLDYLHTYSVLNLHKRTRLDKSVLFCIDTRAHISSEMRESVHGIISTLRQVLLVAEFASFYIYISV